MFLVCHVILQDHVIKGDGNSSITFVCHVTLQDHVIKSKSGFMVRSLSKYVTILRSLVAIGTVLEEIY